MCFACDLYVGNVLVPAFVKGFQMTNVSLEGLFGYVRAQIEAINEVRQTGEKLDAEAIIAKLKSDHAAASVELLAELSIDDLQSCGMPKALASSCRRHFAESLRQSRRPRGGARNVGEMSVDDLIDCLDLDRPESDVARELKKLAGEKRCIAIDKSGGIHRAATKEVFANLEARIPVGERYSYNGQWLDLVQIGYKPPRLLAVHPLDGASVLLLNGRDNYGLHWSGLSEEVRCLLYLAVNDTKELSISLNDGAAVYEVWERVSAEGAVDYLTRVYPKAARRYAELSDDRQLPRMVVRYGGSNERVHPVHKSRV